MKKLWKPARRALDIGAACGRITYDLARDHREAVGVDLSRLLREIAHTDSRSMRDGLKAREELLKGVIGKLGA